MFRTMLNRRLFYIIPPIATTYQPFLLETLETLSGKAVRYRTPAPRENPMGSLFFTLDIYTLSVYNCCIRRSIYETKRPYKSFL